MKNERPHGFRIESDRNVGFNKKYTTIALYAVAIILFLALLLYLLLTPGQVDALLGTLGSIVSPILIGVILAYLLYPAYRIFETKVFISHAIRKKQKCRRALCKAKLRLDFERRKSPIDPASLDAAASALNAARLALSEANAAVVAQKQIREGKIARRSAKHSRPSYFKQSVSKPARLGKTLSLISTYLLFLLFITVIVWIILPSCIRSIGDLLLLCRDLLSTLPKELASNELGRQILELLERYELADDVRNWLVSTSSSLVAAATELLRRLPAFIAGIVSNLTDILLGVFLSIYLLSSKKQLFGQIKKLSKALLPPRVFAYGHHIVLEIDRKFGKFIQGKLTSSAILGVLSFILFGAFGIPYFQMITLIVTVTNLIPFFGPFIGAIPSGIIILISAPEKLIIFILIVLVLQQIEGNILEPRILGNSLGLEPVWIMIAIIVMGELFGILGMILGVPLFAVLFTLISEACNRRLKKKK